jgi:hypothetical protein
MVIPHIFFLCSRLDCQAVVQPLPLDLLTVVLATLCMLLNLAISFTALFVSCGMRTWNTNFTMIQCLVLAVATLL